MHNRPLSTAFTVKSYRMSLDTLPFWSFDTHILPSLICCVCFSYSRRFDLIKLLWHFSQTKYFQGTKRRIGGAAALLFSLLLGPILFNPTTGSSKGPNENSRMRYTTTGFTSPPFSSLQPPTLLLQQGKMKCNWKGKVGFIYICLKIIA